MTNPISVLEMVKLFEYAESYYARGRYGSVHCFSDDVLEILALAERPLPDRMPMVVLRNVRPGQFEFVTVAGTSYTVTMGSTGAVILRLGHGLEKSPFQTPYATISIQRAEREKGVGVDRTWSALGNPVFAALWGRQDSPDPVDKNMCIAFVLEKNEWGMAVDRYHDLGIWAKRYLCFGPKEAAVSRG